MECGCGDDVERGDERERKRIKKCQTERSVRPNTKHTHWQNIRPKSEAVLAVLALCTTEVNFGQYDS